MKYLIDNFEIEKSTDTELAETLTYINKMKPLIRTEVEKRIAKMWLEDFISIPDMAKRFGLSTGTIRYTFLNRVYSNQWRYDSKTGLSYVIVNFLEPFNNRYTNIKIWRKSSHEKKEYLRVACDSNGEPIGVPVKHSYYCDTYLYKFEIL